MRSLQRRVVVEPGREHRHDRLGEQDERGGDAAEHQRDQEEQAGGDPEGLAPLALLQQLGEHRHEGALQRRVGEQRAHQVGHLEGDRERGHRARDAEVAWPPRPRGRGRAPARGPWPRRRTLCCARGGRRAERGPSGRAPWAQSPQPRYTTPLSRRACARAAFFTYMANIASQEKRIHRAERERLENRRYTSSVKTSFRAPRGGRRGQGRRRPRRPTAACSRIDRAARSGAFHKNTGARKKARAMRLRARL